MVCPKTKALDINNKIAVKLKTLKRRVFIKFVYTPIVKISGLGRIVKNDLLSK